MSQPAQTTPRPDDPGPTADLRADGLLAAPGWEATPLGPPEGWPASLAAAARICLTSPAPMLVWWGPELITLGNAAALLAVDLEPEALGLPGPAALPALWPQLSGAVEAALAGTPSAPTVYLPGARPHTCALSPLAGGSGRVDGVLGMLAPAAREETDAVLRVVLDNLPVGLALFDRELRFRQINRRLAAINRLPPEAHLGRTMSDLAPPGHEERRGIAAVEGLISQIFATGQGVYDREVAGPAIDDSADIRHSLASWFPITIDGEVRLVGASILDITDRVRSEHALRMSEERFRRVVESRPMGVLFADTQGRITQANGALLEMLGASPDWLLGKSWPELTPPEYAELDAQAAAELLAAGSVRPYEKEYYTAAGGRLPVLVAATVLRTEDSFEAVGFVLDNSERKRAEAERERLYAQEQAARIQAEEASRLRDDFLATISHELRTPLTAFLGYAELLQRRKRDEAYVARTIEKMVNSARTQAQLIEDLLDVSRIVSGKLPIEAGPVQLERVARAALDTVRPTADAKGLWLRAELPAEGCPVVGDASRLQQVVWNLLANAAKFTPAGGGVTLRLAREGREAVITVSDTGQGIARDFLPYVFDRFRQADSTSQRAHGGLGIGLAIVRHLVEMHGGTVAAASDGPGRGATFTVRLPLALGGAGAPAIPAGDHDHTEECLCQPGLRGLRVLLVDDQPEILDLLGEMLAPCGVAVRSCPTAREALEAVRSWRPDVLVSDIAMPDEDGYWLIERVRALPPEEGGATPALALTAYVRVEDRVRVLAAGFQLYMPKPVEADELRAVLSRLGAGDEGA